jgi:glucose/arabinose dehydrogenase/sugar lactone lactonase YvrE
MRIPLFIFSFLFAALRTDLRATEIDWPDLNFTVVATNIAYPTHINHAGDGSDRLFLVEQPGSIQVLSNGVIQPTPFLNVANRVAFHSGGEQGLFSVAFSPGFRTNRNFYVCYTRLLDGAVNISRFSVPTNSSVADPASEQAILVIPHPIEYHNGGQLAFGPDGYLYISIGDDWSPSANAQNPTSLLGKILRIDVESSTNGYTIPSSNPFVTNSAYRPEIWAMGLRNPWRFSFDRLTGDLYIADVGFHREEVNFQPANSAGGENYGWPMREGFQANLWSEITTNIALLTDPIVDCRSSEGNAMIGGFVVRSTNASRLNGIYICGAYGSSIIWGAVRTGTNWQMVHLNDKTFPIDNGTFNSPTTFGEDEAGNIYVADATWGRILRIDASQKALRPVFDPPGNEKYYLDHDSIVLNTDVVTVHSCVGAKIYYTTNGDDPTFSDAMIYSGDTITVMDSMLVKAQAFRTDLTPSDIGPLRVFLDLGLAISPPEGTSVTNSTYITVTCTPSDAMIEYSLNHDVYSLDDGDRMPYTGPFPVNGDTTVRAYASKPGFPDAEQEIFYPWAKVNTPVFAPASGPITNGTQISIGCSTSDAEIFYTLDRIVPTTNSTRYTGPFVIDGDTTVQAIAFKDTFAPSTMQGVLFNLVPPPAPIFTPPSGRVTNGIPLSVSIASTIPGATIYYTVNGTVPTTNSPVYNAPVQIFGNVTLSAKAVRAGYDDSAIQRAFYGLISFEKVTVATIAGSGQAGFGDGSGLMAQLNSPCGLCLDSLGDLYIADTGNNRIRKITSGGELVTVAGSGIAGSLDAHGTNAQFSGPVGICIDLAHNLFVTDRNNSDRVRKVTSTGNVSTIANLSLVEFSPSVWTIDVDLAGKIFVGSWYQIIQIDTNGAATRFAGPGNDSIPQGYRFSPWSSDVGLCLDPQRNIVMTTAWRVALVSTNGNDVTYAGWGPAVTDGPRLLAGFENPRDCALDTFGNIYVSDDVWIRKVSTNGIVSTLAGTGIAGYASGSGMTAQFDSAAGICVDTNGNVYVADANNNRIRRISVDSDSDGIPDFEETATSGFIVGLDDRTRDSDGDGQSNADEYIAGTNPLSAASRFKINDANRVGNNLTLSWDACANRMYQLSASSNLISWNVVTNIPNASPGTLSITLTNTGASSVNQFYRLRAWIP